MIDIERLVSEAKAGLKGTGDDKSWCRTDEMLALLEAGATKKIINQELGRENYLHEVSYEGITFVNSTEEAVPELEKYK